MSQRINYTHQSSEQFKKLMELSGAIHASPIAKEMGDLVNIRASQINGCAFCLDMHVKEARLHGERELRIYHIPIWRESSLFNDRERAALDWTETVTKLDGHGISDEAFERAKVYLSEKEISDLTFAIGLINIWNRLSVSFAVVPGSADAAYGLDKAGLK